MNSTFFTSYFQQYKELPDIATMLLALSFTIVFLTLRVLLAGLDEIRDLYTRTIDTITTIKVNNHRMEERVKDVEKTTVDSLDKIYSILLEQKTELMDLVEDINTLKGNNSTPHIDYNCDFMTDNVRE